jgi:hypothetical protein
VSDLAEPKYPHIEVQLTGNDGNAFAIMGAVRRALVENKIEKEEIEKYMADSMAGDYDALLRTAMQWVTVL